ncbi:hypothetical protein [Nocardioides daejeonensis]|uniref:hypothetical protein n=1 Tax=Nocardioides daejeonensis TaxID=1046556 RepID=UPI000D746B3D|nr:hypothetical protein [Nocardioides daejeonensis]
MTTAIVVTAAFCAVTLLAVVIAGALLVRTARAQARRTELALAEARAEAEALRARVDALALTAAPTVVEEYVITGLGTEVDETAARPVAERIDGRLFVDIVARESVVKAAAFGHGLRQALSPESRNRIRFEMKREMKRLRKERRTIVRSLKREAAIRQRAARDLRMEETA